jgi:hypothetical protein
MMVKVHKSKKNERMMKYTSLIQVTSSKNKVEEGFF